jgi:hypothetical protein
MVDETTPDLLNTELSNPPTVDINSSGGLDLKQAAQDLKFNYQISYSTAATAIVDALCDTRNSIIAEVPHYGHSHFVVVTGQTINPATHNCDFSIADPASNPQNNFLSQYGSVTSLRILTK